MTEPGMLLEITRSHFVFCVAGGFDALEVGELVWVVNVDTPFQAQVLRISTGQLVHILTIESTTYVNVFR